MSTVTTYLNLVKPATLEQYSLATTNNNLDLIDAGISAVNTFSKKMRHAEFTATMTGNTAGAFWDIGILNASAAPLTVNNTFCVPDGAGKLKFTEPGIYEVTVVCKPTTAPGANLVSIKDGADSFYYDIRDAGGAYWENAAKAFVYVPDDTDVTVLFRTKWTNSITVNSTVRVNKVIGP